MSDPTKQPPSQPALVCEKCGGYGWHPIHDAEGTEIGTPEREACGGTGRSKEANLLGSAAWSSTPPTGPGYFWSRSHGGTPVIAWHTADGVRMSCDQTVIVLDSDEGRDWMATQDVEFWPEPIVFYGSRRSSCNQRQVMAFDETDENGSRVGFEMIAFGSRIRIGVIRGRLPTLWFFAPPTVAARQWACPKGSWSMRVWRLSIARRPNHKVSHGQ